MLFGQAPEYGPGVVHGVDRINDHGAAQLQVVARQVGDGLVAVVLEVVVVGHADEGCLQGVEAEVDGAERVGKQSCLGGFAYAW